MAFAGNYMCISIEVICFFGVIIANAVLYEMMYLRHGGVQPFKRGFFCNDRTVMKPYHSENLSFAGTLTSGIIFALTMILLLEIGNYLSKSKEHREPDSDGRYVGPVLIPVYVIRMIHRMAIFGVGLGLVMILCNTIAILSGRLRPNFLAVCQPNTTLFNCSDGYITHDVCTGDPLRVKIARFSFPSAHTSVTTYAMMFIAIYLQASFCLRKYKLLRMILQTASILLGFAVGLSRLRDYHHHWLDVVGGAFIGAFSAWIVSVKVIGVFNDKERREPKEYMYLPQADDEAKEVKHAGKNKEELSDSYNTMTRSLLDD